MKMRSAICGSWARLGIVIVLLCVHFFALNGLLSPDKVLAQSGQLNPAGQPGALPDIVPNIVPSAKEKHTPVRLLNDRLPEKPTVVPAFTIPVAALGFTAPGAIYLGHRFSLASLDFLSDDHLLFTFRVPGLIRRENGHKPGEDERQIRAVVVEVKTGRVEAQALWTVHDRSRYLWMLKDGHFLLRDRDGLEQGDISLILKPFLQFPGSVEWLEMDPQQQYMVTNSTEPAKVEAKPGQVDSPSAAAVTMEADAQKTSLPSDPNASDPPDTVVRILERATGKVMLVSRVRSSVHLPINADGYLERLRGNGQMWMINMNYFTGGSRILAHVESYCFPVFDFISQSEILVSGCTSWGGTHLGAFTTDGRRLWEEDVTSSECWPIAAMSPDGSRMAYETLEVSRPVNNYNPIDSNDVKGQLVRIINAADGAVALEAAASPQLDMGGNVAISPGGRRVAVLSDGAIQVFELPAAPALPASPTAPAIKK
jgi:hypothetical protein